jgi:hypothetical protein
MFYLKKNNLSRNGEAPIMACITIDGTISQFSCKASVRPDLWETKYNRAAGRSYHARQINSLLDAPEIQKCVPAPGGVYQMETMTVNAEEWNELTRKIDRIAGFIVYFTAQNSDSILALSSLLFTRR